jgi:hypothetical protein
MDGGLQRDAHAIALKLGGWRGTVMVELLVLVQEQSVVFPRWLVLGRKEAAFVGRRGSDR